MCNILGEWLKQSQYQSTKNYPNKQIYFITSSTVTSSTTSTNILLYMEENDSIKKCMQCKSCLYNELLLYVIIRGENSAQAEPRMNIANGVSNWCSLKWSAIMLNFYIDSVACGKHHIIIRASTLFTVLRSAVFIQVSINTTLQVYFYTFTLTHTQMFQEPLLTNIHCQINVVLHLNLPQ